LGQIYLIYVNLYIIMIRMSVWTAEIDYDVVMFQSDYPTEGGRTMARIVSSMILTLLLTTTVSAENPDELSAIRETALNYMDSWYKGDSKRMKQSLHKKLAKRSLQDSVSGKKLLRFTSASDMVWYTRGGYGENLWYDNLNIEVIVLDIYRDIASVKVITPHYYEYLHLVKHDEKWVILNALYERNSPRDD